MIPPDMPLSYYTMNDWNFIFFIASCKIKYVGGLYEKNIFLFYRS